MNTTSALNVRCIWEHTVLYPTMQCTHLDAIFTPKLHSKSERTALIPEMKTGRHSQNYTWRQLSELLSDWFKVWSHFLLCQCNLVKSGVISTHRFTTVKVGRYRKLLGLKETSCITTLACLQNLRVCHITHNVISVSLRYYYSIYSYNESVLLLDVLLLFKIYYSFSNFVVLSHF